MTAAGCAPAQPAEISTPTAAPSETTAGGSPVILLRRGGGFAGETLEWQLFSDGRVTATKNRDPQSDFRVTSQSVDEFLKWLDGSGFFAAKIEAPNRDEMCCDRFVYEMLVNYNGKRQQITVIDTPENLPDSLAEAFRRLETLLGLDI